MYVLLERKLFPRTPGSVSTAVSRYVKSIPGTHYLHTCSSTLLGLQSRFGDKAIPGIISSSLSLERDCGPRKIKHPLFGISFSMFQIFRMIRIRYQERFLLLLVYRRF